MTVGPIQVFGLAVILAVCAGAPAMADTADPTPSAPPAAPASLAAVADDDAWRRATLARLAAITRPERCGRCKPDGREADKAAPHPE